jgi:arsenate reductase-like glutaredoxin family protein
MKINAKTIRIPDCSTAQGIVDYIEQRIEDIQVHGDADRGTSREFIALLKMIEGDIDAMLDDMERESQERAKQMAIQLQDAGVTEEMLKARSF